MLKTFSVLFLFIFFSIPSARSEIKFATSLPLLIDENYTRNVFASPDPEDSKFLIESHGVIEALEPILPDDILTQLKISQKTLSLSDLKRVGILTKFDESTLKLHLTIPPEKKRINSIDAIDGIRNYQSQKIHSAPWSGYLNLRGSETVSYYSGSGTTSTHETRREPFLANAEFVANYKKLVLQNDMDFLEKRETTLLRQSTQVIYDFESQLVRATAGDLNLKTAGFQSSRNIGGISLARETSIQPSKFFGSNRDGQIFLKRQSDVEIKVNSAVVRRVKLPAGTHNLRDFPLNPGTNRIEFHIVDDLGRKELIEIPMLYDLNLLPLDLHQYGYAAGVVSSNSPSGKKTYSNDQKMFSAFHRFGFKKYWTPGANFQIDPSGSLFGLENRLMSPVGYWSLDTAQTNQKTLENSLGGSSALRLRFESLVYDNNRITPFMISSGFEWRGSNFLTPGNLKSNNPQKWIFDLGLHNRLADALALATNFRMNNNWNEPRIDKTVGLDLNKRWGNGEWQTSLAYHYSTQPGATHRLLLTINWYATSGANVIVASHETSTKTTRVDWNHHPKNKLNSIHTSGALQNNLTGPSAELTLAHTREKSEFSFQQKSAFDTAQNLGSHQSTMHFGTAIAWTDKGIGITRPINDSFAMILQQGQNNLRGTKLAVNKSDDGAQAYLNDGALTILPELQSYNDMPVSIDVNTLPVGYSLSPEFSILRPSYRSGATMILKTAKSVTVTGLLKDKQGTPIQLQTGVVVISGESGKTSSSFFTNDLGQYYIEGVQGEAFDLVLDSPKYEALHVTMPPIAEGVIQLPDLVVKEVP